MKQTCNRVSLILWFSCGQRLSLWIPDLISQNMASHIRALDFVVANLPHWTPEGASRSSQQQATMASDVVKYNTNLNQSKQLVKFAKSAIDVTL